MAWTQQLREFVKDVRVESTKISWPTRSELRESTSVVIVTVLLVTLFVGVVDQGLTVLVGLLFR
ncbi:MAG: preprotein translocase subunit SecE [Candidatus Eisenbacteria bacterium]|nr:preprotein translocase subunit SecE [Candidatus Eisenbacteria bacterium]